MKSTKYKLKVISEDNNESEAELIRAAAGSGPNTSEFDAGTKEWRFTT